MTAFGATGAAATFSAGASFGAWGTAAAFSGITAFGTSGAVADISRITGASSPRVFCEGDRPTLAATAFGSTGSGAALSPKAVSASSTEMSTAVFSALALAATVSVGSRTASSRTRSSTRSFSETNSGAAGASRSDVSKILSSSTSASATAGAETPLVLSHSGRFSVASASRTAVSTISLSRCTAERSRSPKAFTFPEKSSKTPSTSSSFTTGITITEAMPKWRHTSRLTRASRSASSQRKGWRVRTLSPDSPNSVERSAPNSGAFDPVLARHCMSFLPARRSAIAAPLALVMYCARSTSNCSAASRSRRAISASEYTPSSSETRTLEERLVEVGGAVAHEA